MGIVDGGVLAESESFGGTSFAATPLEEAPSAPFPSGHTAKSRCEESGSSSHASTSTSRSWRQVALSRKCVWSRC